MAVAARPHARPEIRRRRLQGCPAHRFGDHRADVALHLQHIIDIIRQPLMRVSVVAEEPWRQRWRWDVFSAWQQRAGSRRKIASPPTEIASSDAPWNASHIDSVLCRPVAWRASFSAMPIAAVPDGANSTLSGVRAPAPPVAAPARSPRGWCSAAAQNGSVASCRVTASITRGWP